MERKGGPVFTFASSNWLAVHANKGGTANEIVDTEVWHSAAVGKSAVETEREIWPCVTDLQSVAAANVAATNCLLSAAIGASRADGSLGATPVIAPSYRGAFQGNQLLSGSPITPTKNEFNMEPYCAQPAKCDVQLSEACQRRFVMFDSSGSKRRMIFHPALVNELPTLVTRSPHGPGSYLKSIPDGTLPAPPSNVVFPMGAPLPCYAYAPLTANPCLDLQSSASNHGLDRLFIRKEGTEDKMEENLISYSHENTEDLEALLSFDDGQDAGDDNDNDNEVTSTGHSPSDFTRNNVSMCSDNNGRSQSLCPSKKRKRGVEIRVEDDYDDTASTTISGNLTCKETLGSYLAYGREDVTSDEANHGKCLGTKAWGYGKGNLMDVNLTLPDEWSWGYGKGNLMDFNLTLPDEWSSNSSGNNQRYNNGKHQQEHEEEMLVLNRHSRKKKIKSILRLLRGIVPGGESKDATFVLDETIEYVRALQFEVQKLQAR